MKPKLLATSWHPGGINSIAPVIKKLREDGLVDVVTVGYQFSEPILDSHRIPYKKIADYGLTDVSLSSMDRLLSQESPALVLTGTSAQDEKNKDVIEQTATLAATKKGIPAIAVLDFWGNYSERFNDIYTKERFRFLPDAVAIMDQYAEKDMLAEGFEKSRLVITGNPHFDGLERKAKEFTEDEKRKLRETIGITCDVLAFYAANAWKKEKASFGFWDLDNIILANQALQELPQLKTGLVVKVHPRVPEEDLTEIRSYLDSSSDKRVKLVLGINPQELVLASDFTLTPFSTVGIEAVYMRKPLISMQPNLSTQDYLTVLTKNNLVPVGYTPEQCKELVQKAYADANYRSQLVENASSFRTDGKATERVAELVYKMMGKIK